MSKYDEEEIIRQLERLSKVEPKQDLQIRAMRDMRNRIEGNAFKTGEKHLKLFNKPFIRFAIAAGIIMAAGLFVLLFNNNGQQNVRKQFAANGYVSSCVSMIELRKAYNRGGVDEIEKQYDEEYLRYDKGGNGISINDIINSL